MVGSKRTKIATLVERKTRFVMLVKMPADDSKSIVDALARVQKLPAELRRSLTWDRGVEMQSTSASPWRPTCKCTSAIRTVLGSAAAMRTPTGCCDSTSRRAPICHALSAAWIRSLGELNERPRKTLGFRTPAAKLRSVAMTGRTRSERSSSALTIAPGGYRHKRRAQTAASSNGCKHSHDERERSAEEPERMSSRTLRRALSASK